MPQTSSYTFKAIIYKTGINYCVDVPADITSRLQKVKGYIRIKGTVNGIYFTKSLVPVKGAPYRLFINTITMKGIREMVSQIAELSITADLSNPEEEHPMHPQLLNKLQQHGLLHRFDALTPSRRKEILRYLNNIKTPETLEKNIQKAIKQLQAASADVRVP